MNCRKGAKAYGLGEIVVCLGGKCNKKEKLREKSRVDREKSERKVHEALSTRLRLKSAVREIGIFSFLSHRKLSAWSHITMWSKITTPIPADLWWKMIAWVLKHTNRIQFRVWWNRGPVLSSLVLRSMKMLVNPLNSTSDIFPQAVACERAKNIDWNEYLHAHELLLNANRFHTEKGDELDLVEGFMSFFKDLHFKCWVHCNSRGIESLHSIVVVSIHLEWNDLQKWIWGIEWKREHFINILQQ